MYACVAFARLLDIIFDLETELLLLFFLPFSGQTPAQVSVPIFFHNTQTRTQVSYAGF